MFIKTNRLLIREFEIQDWQAVYEYTSNPNVMKYIPEGVLMKKKLKSSYQKIAVNKQNTSLLF